MEAIARERKVGGKWQENRQRQQEKTNHVKVIGVFMRVYVGSAATLSDALQATAAPAPAQSPDVIR